MIPFFCTDVHHPRVLSLIERFALLPSASLPDGHNHYLCWDQGALSLRQHKTCVIVDFSTGAMRHRRQYGGGLGQPIAKAIGVKSTYLPHVLDATAGLGRDAFILASLGCTVTLLERSVIAAALLTDGLARAQENVELKEIIARMTLITTAAQDYIAGLDKKYDVVYLDPMFPEHAKSALPKKEMQAFQALIGTDEDSATLLPLARQVAHKRIVVKRSVNAPWLNKEKPHYSLSGKSTRFDIYLP
jgi:16S rRNA (guanine1516-N2)-methyltransferase